MNNERNDKNGNIKLLVYVIALDGKPLMPCKPAKARKLQRNRNYFTKAVLIKQNRGYGFYPIE